MPNTRVVLYKDDNHRVPLVDWLADLQQEARARCFVLIEMLKDNGYELDRPAAAILKDGIHELRAKFGKLQLRMLYFFDKKAPIVITHGFIKRGKKVPPGEIERAKHFRDRYQADPGGHTHEG